MTLSLRTVATLLAATAALHVATACSDIVVAGKYGYAYPDETMSTRSLDFPVLDTVSVRCFWGVEKIGSRLARLHSHTFLFPSPHQYYIAYVPSGTAINRTRSLSTAPSPPTKLGFVCLSGEAVAARVNEGHGNTQPGLCFDGLNEKGLSASYLWHSRSETAPHAGYADDVATDKLTVSYWDFLAFVLGECDTVDCAVDFLKNTPVITNTETEKFAKSRFHIPWMPLHAVFTDKTGAVVLIEWTATKGNPVVYYQDAQGGVTTNSGSYPYLQRVVDAVRNQSAASNGNAYGDALVQAGYPGGLVWGNQISPASPVADTLVNGELPLNMQNSVSRFVRTSMLRDLVGPQKWGKPNNPLSPESYGTATAAAMQADGLMNSASLPGKFPACMPKCEKRSDEDVGGTDTYSAQNEATLVRTLRDHKRGLYYLRTVYNPTYHRIDVKQYLAAAPPNKATIIALTDMIGGTWWATAPLPGTSGKVQATTTA
jgi:penicillin V acylase-like amidase (Ntn superfamily)